ncbi:extracellular matrix-binding ebh [Babesia caballi]|uniref:Extracellular matrix-binding ebh n=1 Tax=Babesia caballi TaxID=5871 RepID=A0AAV4M1C7_BABCB|nr:extracellular matrix-binding ebh [Babesia caballi]
MCANNVDKCGWQECRYGKDINSGSNNSAPSHICNGYNCKNNQCQHDGSGSYTQCTHNQGGYGAKCGTGNSMSPLQALLTDKLKGFSRGHPSDTSSHLAFCSGSTCHVPMGFKAEDLRSEPKNGAQGENICLTLRPLCGGFNTPLRQLSEKLGCLAKRTPRTLGDLFGFTWHLNGQLFKNERPTLEGLIGKFDTAFGMSSSLPDTFTKNPYSAIIELWNHIAKLNPGSSSSSATGLSLSLEAMAPAIPFLYQLFMARDEDSLPLVLFDLYQQCHKVETVNQGGQQKIVITHNSPSGHQCSTSPADLFSLQTSGCSQTNCGPYLYPLTHSDGATFAPRHASTYLSWVLYLSDDLQSWFQEMLDEFRNINCTKSGCHGQKCQAEHGPGQHGSSPSCQCASVVQCGGTLPLLYRHGFRYYSPLVLMGGSSGNGETKRNCEAFANQLQSVLAGDPLNNLITTIDEFLYLFRFYFFYNQSAFWTIYTGLILYTFFFLLDTLRVRSHLHFPSSNSIAPISLLGTGKAPALTKFTKLTYFMP